MKPTINEVIPLVNKYYSMPENGCGGSLHNVLDDGNISDRDILFCLDEAKKNSDKEGIELANLLLKMSKIQRRKVYMELWNTRA